MTFDATKNTDQKTSKAGIFAFFASLKTSYEKGVKICGKEKAKMEERLKLSERLPLYDITINPKTVY